MYMLSTMSPYIEVGANELINTPYETKCKGVLRKRRSPFLKKTAKMKDVHYFR